MMMTGTEPITVRCVGVERVGAVADRLGSVDGAFEVRSGAQSTTALDRSTADPPDAYLVGPAPADSDPLAVVEALRAADEAVPVVVCDPDGELGGDALGAGASEVLLGSPTAVAPAVLARRLRTVVERDRAAAEAAQQRQRLRALLSNSTDRISVLDADATYRFVSPAFERLLGYDTEELVGSSGFDYVHPDDREQVRAAFERLLEIPDARETVTYRLRDADGEWRWVESEGTNRLDDPAVEGIVVNSREVTDERARREQPREERAFTQSILDALPDVFYAFDEAGTFLRWNDRFAEVTGYTDDEIADMQPTDFIAPDDQGAVFDAIMRVFQEDRAVTVEARFETKAGETIPYEFTGAKLTEEDGEPLGLVGIGRDITDRKRRQRRFEAVFNNTYQFTGLIEPDGTIVEANETALQFAGVDREDVIGTPLWESHWFQADSQSRAVAREAVEQAREGELYRAEITVQGATGTEEIDFSVRPITDEDGEVTLLIPEGRQITELKRRERHLSVLHRFLRHNLRNKMSVIGGLAGHLRESLDDPELAAVVSDIETAASELTELSETARELSHVPVEAGEDRQPVPLGETLTEVARTLRDRHPSATVEVEGGDGVTVAAGPRLRSVFEQLVENGIVHDDAAEPRVEIAVETGADTVTVRVADDGPGIAESELAGITGGGEWTQLEHGTGFGLWLVRSVVDSYGGDLAHESTPDHGTVFAVTLDRVDGE